MTLYVQIRKDRPQVLGKRYQAARSVATNRYRIDGSYVEADIHEIVLIHLLIDLLQHHIESNQLRKALPTALPNMIRWLMSNPPT